MAIITSSGTIYAAPRVIEAKDTRAGCPGAAADGSTLISSTIVVSNPSTYWAHGRIIFLPSADGTVRSDFLLRLNGAGLKSSLDTATNSAGAAVGSWDELDATFMGTLAAGTHTFTMIGINGVNCWGCGADWGQLTVLVWEAA
jgi:hypothetical protein